MRILFSILSYRPSFISEEQINIGVLFHNMDTKEIKFHMITNWNRLEVFDDELDIRYFKIILKGIKSHILKNENNFDMENYISRYNNEIRFSKVKIKETDNFEDFVNRTRKIFLKYDFEKRQRLSKIEQKRYVKELLDDNSIEYSNSSITSIFNDSINYDYIIGNIGIKIFSLKNKIASKMIFSARAWNQIAKQVKPRFETVFIYDVDTNDDNYKVVLDILSDSGAKLIKLENVLDFISSNDKLMEIPNQLKIKGI